MHLKYSIVAWQRIIIILVILTGVLFPILFALSWAVWGWPNFPKHRTLDIFKYTERVMLLKYFISLGFSLIGATWYLVSNKAGNYDLPKRFYDLLSWVWTFLGISLLGAISQIYLTYKDFYYWPLITAEGYTCRFQHFMHCTGTRMLHASYGTTDWFFFLGAFFLILALVEVLHVTNQSNHRK